MEYLADTVAIIRHLRQLKSLGRSARRILQEADAGTHRIYICLEPMFVSAGHPSGFGRDMMEERLWNWKATSIS